MRLKIRPSHCLKLIGSCFLLILVATATSKGLVVYKMPAAMAVVNLMPVINSVTLAAKKIDSSRADFKKDRVMVNFDVRAMGMMRRVAMRNLEKSVVKGPTSSRINFMAMPMVLPMREARRRAGRARR